MCVSASVLHIYVKIFESYNNPIQIKSFAI